MRLGLFQSPLALAPRLDDPAEDRRLRCADIPSSTHETSQYRVALITKRHIIPLKIQQTAASGTLLTLG
jgi:hypothetical protein